MINFVTFAPVFSYKYIVRNKFFYVDMRNIFLTIALAAICFGCDNLPVDLPDLFDELPLTEDEVGAGLKEALSIGCNVATKSASADGGFLNNPLIRILLPPEAQGLIDKVDGVESSIPPVLKLVATEFGLMEMLDFSDEMSELEVAMNRAAEVAAKTALDIFIGAVTEMTIFDAYGILNGSSDTAAMHYMRVHTTTPLKENFSPIVKDAIDKVEVVTQFWEPVINKYNDINTIIKNINSTPTAYLVKIPPLGDPINPDLNEYITNKAINGLMILVGEQEEKIRTNPLERTSELLKRVFGKK